MEVGGVGEGGRLESGQRRAVEEAVESKSMAIINQVLVAAAAAPSSLEPRVTDCPEGSGVDSSSMRAEGGGRGLAKAKK